MSKKAASCERLSWTEERVFEGLRKLFPAPAFIPLPQVRNHTGFARRVRTADALAASVWPSRGLYFAGVEIKVAVSDWRRELADAAKSTEVQRFCQHWYVAAPEAVVPLAEVPPNWGLIHVGVASAKIVKPAPTLAAETPSMGFVCSVLRAAAEISVPAFEVAARIEAARQSAQEDQRLQAERRLKELSEQIAEFEAASGLRINRWDAGNIGAAVRFVRETGVMRAAEMMRRLRDEAAAIVKTAERAIGELNDREAATNEE